MQRSLVPFLACPTCAYDPLVLRSRERGDDIQGGELLCARCGRRCPIVDGIVDMLGGAPLPVTPAQLTNYAPPAAWGYERLWRWQALTRLSGERLTLTRELGLVRALMAPERGGLLVDVACSLALYARAWATTATADTVLLGLDHSWAMLRAAQRAAAGARQPISLVRGSAQALPLRAGAAAGVGLGGSLNEIGDAAAALREVRRVLAPDGRFVNMSLVAASSGWGRALQGALGAGGIAFPSRAALNAQLVAARLQPWAQWQWRVVTITAARPVEAL